MSQISHVRLQDTSEEESKIYQFEKVATPNFAVKMVPESRLPLFLNVVGFLLAIVATLLSLVALSQRGVTNVYHSDFASVDGMTLTPEGKPTGLNSLNPKDDKIWLLQVGHWNHVTQYFDEESGQIKGYDIDVVNAVCQLANKNCAIVYDLYENCWNAMAGKRHSGGVGLMARWYDACVGWQPTPYRLKSFDFTTPIRKDTTTLGLYKRKGSNVFVNAVDTFSLAGMKVGFIDGWFADETCLAKSPRILNFHPITSSIIHYQHEDEVVEALDSRKIDVAFVSRQPIFEKKLQLISVLENIPGCKTRDDAVMYRRDVPSFAAWWDAAFSRLIKSHLYEEICDRIETEHGYIGGATAQQICFGNPSPGSTNEE